MEVQVTITEFMNLLETFNYASGTVANYRYGLKRFKDYLQERGITDMRKVTAQIILDYQALVMANTAHATESKAMRIRPVKRLFEYLTNNNFLLINPTEGIIETHRREKVIGLTYTQAEIKKLLEQPNMSLNSGIRDRTIMELLYATAMRADEMLSLDVHDVNLKDGVIFVRKAKGKRQRVVPIGKHAAAFLREYLEKIRPHHNKKQLKERRLFLNNKGKPMTYQNLQHNIYLYGKSAKLSKTAAPHAFRRSCATHMMLTGADIRHIQKLLGHARLSTTQQYCKVIPIDIKKTHKETHPNECKGTDTGIP